MYATYTLNRKTGELSSLNARDVKPDKYVAFCMNALRRVAPPARF